MQIFNRTCCESMRHGFIKEKSDTKTMVDVSNTQLDITAKRLFDLHSSFGWDFVKEAWNSRRLLVSFAVVGLISGAVLGYMLPKSYTIKLELTPSPIEKYDKIFSTLFTRVALSADSKNESDVSRPESKIISDAMSQTVYSQKILSFAMQKSLTTNSKSETEFSDIINLNKLSPGRGLEKYFVQGYSVEFSLKNRNELAQLVENYSTEFKNNVNQKVKDVLIDTLKINLKINDLNFEVSKKIYKIDTKNNIEYTREAVDIARIGAIAKPIMPPQMPITAQIPLENAVPKYFFGYEVLEQEKKQLEDNAKDETRIPGYSAFVAESNRLSAMADFIAKANLSFVDVQIFPEVSVKNGFLTKLALVIATTILLISAGCLVIALRILRRKISQ